jgi:glyoxylase-like metal-dependent hydrolase (beta-lactamase superfamily II)/rhodanese-related sulfurtransferase
MTNKQDSIYETDANSGSKGYTKDHFTFKVTPNNLQQKLDSKGEPFMIFDIGDKQRYEKEHVPGSKFAVCDEQTIKSLLPKLPKDTEIILIADDEDYAKQMAQMASNKGGLKARYLSGGISSWSGKTTSQQDPKIKSNDLKKDIDKAMVKSGDIILLDVREPDEFKQWNIEGSINIPLGQVPTTLYKIPKDKEIVTICPHGNRSGMVTYMLQRQGYNTKTLEGGLKEWSSAFEYTSKEYTISNGKTVNVIQVRKIGKGCLSYIVSFLDQSRCSNKETDKKVNNDDNEHGDNFGTNKHAIVIDPVFPVDEYTRIANLKWGGNTKISAVLDTHLHADHISAARDLSKRTGAPLYLSSYEDYSTNSSSDQVENNNHTSFSLTSSSSSSSSSYILLKEGKTQMTHIVTSDRTVKKKNNDNNKKHDIPDLEIIHTPGHTQGSLCFLFGNSLLFTGDTLFVDSIGRPDLRDKAEEFAPMLYESIHNKIFGIKKNKSEVYVFPGHTDRLINSNEILTANLTDIRQQAKYLSLSKEEFVSKVISITNPTPPQYKNIIQINKCEKEAPSLDQIKDLEMGPNRCSIS